MTLYFAVFMEFGTCPDFSLPLLISMARGPLWALPFCDPLWPFLLPCRSYNINTHPLHQCTANGGSSDTGQLVRYRKPAD